MGKKHWRGPSVDKNGVRRRGGWVKGKNPAPGCQFWLIGMTAITAAVIAKRATRRT